MVECGGLENRCPFTRTGGSNPSFSANLRQPHPWCGFFVFACPVPKSSQGWGDAFMAMHDTGDDTLLLADVFQEEEEWN